MKFIDADVKRPLGSVADMMDGGNDVHFAEGGSYIENRRTKERIPIERRDRTFILTLNGTGIKTGEKNRRKSDKNADMEVDGVEEKGGIEEEEWRRMEEYARTKMGKGHLVFRRQM